MALVDLDEIRPWSWQNRVQAKKQNASTVQRIASQVRPYVEKGDFAGAQQALQQAAPPPPQTRGPSPLMRRVGERVGAAFEEMKAQQTRMGVQGTAKTEDDGGFLDAVKGGVLRTVRGVKAVNEGIEDAGYAMSRYNPLSRATGVTPPTEAEFEGGARGERMAAGLQRAGDIGMASVSGERFVNNLAGRDVTSGLPAPVRYGIESFAAPVTLATAGTAGLAGGGLKAVGQAVAKRWALEGTSDLAGRVTAEQVANRLPEGTPAPVRIGTSLLAGVAGGAATYKGLQQAPGVARAFKEGIDAQGGLASELGEVQLPGKGVPGGGVPQSGDVQEHYFDQFNGERGTLTTADGRSFLVVERTPNGWREFRRRASPEWPSLDDAKKALVERDARLHPPPIVRKPETGIAARFPRVGEKVDGLNVGTDIPNTSSISSALNEWEEIPGIREINIGDMPSGGYVSASDRQRVNALADAINQSGRIDPLIAVVDNEGLYILEGSHRFEALKKLGKKTAPAVVVLDTESLPSNELGYIRPQLATTAAGAAAGGLYGATHPEDGPGGGSLGSALMYGAIGASGVYGITRGVAMLPRKNNVIPGTRSGAPFHIPDVGTAGIQQAIAEKLSVYRDPNSLVTKWAPVRKGAAWLAPAVDMDKQVLSAYRAKAGVRASLRTQFDATLDPYIRRVEALVTKDAPEYIGPAATTPGQKALIGTIKDMADRPEAYRIAPDLRAALDDLNVAQWNDVSAVVRGQFGVEVRPFTASGKPGFVHLPTVRTADTDADKIAAQLAALGTKQGAKTRAYATAWERAAADAEFIPETNIRELTGIHSEAMASDAANQTFRQGAGGKTLTEVMDELHPKLRESKERVRNDIANLRARLQTVNQQFRGAALEQADLTRAQRVADARLQRINDQIEALGDDFGPELSHLSGQAYELRLEFERLGRAATKAGQTAYWKRGTQTQALKDAVAVAEADLHKLVQAYKAAEIDPQQYLREPSTMRYYRPDAAKTVNSLLSQPAGKGKALIEIGDEIRAFHLAGDASPLTVQGQLAVLSDPVNLGAAIKWLGVDRSDPRAILRQVAQNEVDDVRDYTRATGRAFGQQAFELSATQQGKRGLARIPGVKPVEDWMFSAIELAQYRSWQRDRDLLLKMNPGRDRTWAANESARAWEKIIPSLSPAERGVSATRGGVERTLLTSVSFAASPAMLTKEAASGLVKLGIARTMDPAKAWRTLDGREQIAIMRLATFAGGVAMVSGISAAASAPSRNMSVEDAINRAVFDWNSPEWMSLQIGEGRRIPIGGPLRGFIKAMLPDKDGVPMARMGDWLEGRLNTLPRVTKDLIRNEDWRGNKIVKGDFPENILRTLAYGVENVVPISAGEVMEQFRTGEATIGSAIIGSASQLAGTNYVPPSPSERLHQIARDEYGKDFWGLSPSQKKAIREREPGLWRDYVASASEETQLAAAEKQRFMDEQAADDDAVLRGELSLDDWAKALDDRRNQLVGAEKIIYRNLESGGKRDPILDGYYAAIDEATVNGRVDWNAVDAYKASLPTADLRYINENTGLTQTALTKLRKDLGSQYYALPRYRGFSAEDARNIDALYQDARNMAGSRADNPAVMVRAIRLAARQNGYEGRAVRGALLRANGRLEQTAHRERWMRAHPEGVLLTGSGRMSKAQQDAIKRALAR